MQFANFCVCEDCESTFSNPLNRCQSCANPITENLEFCGACLNHTPAFSRAYTLYDYQGLIAQLIKLFKYDKQLCIGHYFAHKLHNFYQSLECYDAIIPMPLNSKRIRQRGFNQALEILRVIKQRTDCIIDVNSVKRIKATKSLANLNPQQRQKELKYAFQSKPIAYQHILLVDDVITTGASLNELAKTLIKAGALSCDVLTLAKTPALN